MSAWKSLVVAGVLVGAALAAGCGAQIGDSCSVATDCETDGTRICDLTQPSGYCTIQGCDYDTCPGEATCVRFFVGGFTNRTCDPMTEDISTNNCSIDELCSLDGFCEPRSAEQRYCMKTCSNNGDCRDGYECRNESLAAQDGGEVVLGPGQLESASTPSFCAPAPASN